MTDDLIALGKRAVACKAWRWMPGMRAVEETPEGQYARRIALNDESDDAFTPAAPNSAWRPDLSDPATLGCLLALVREAYDNPTLTPLTAAYGSVVLGHPWRGGASCVGVGPTEAAALVAALEAAPL